MSTVAILFVFPWQLGRTNNTMLYFSKKKRPLGHFGHKIHKFARHKTDGCLLPPLCSIAKFDAIICFMPGIHLCIAYAAVSVRLIPHHKPFPVKNT